MNVKMYYYCGIHVVENVNMQLVVW